MSYSIVQPVPCWHVAHTALNHVFRQQKTIRHYIDYTVHLSHHWTIYRLKTAENKSIAAKDLSCLLLL